MSAGGDGVARGGVVVWFTGLPGAGKSTLATRVADALRARGVAACLLDSDEVRAALSPAPDYSERGRGDFYRTLAGLATLLARQRLAVLVAATAHRRGYRDWARQGAQEFFEVWVDTPLDECERRDPKRLYAAARAGRISGLPGVDVDYEPPLAPAAIARGGRDAQAARVIATRVSRALRTG